MLWFLIKICIVLFVLGALMDIFASMLEDICKVFSFLVGSKRQKEQPQQQQNDNIEKPKYDHYEFKTFSDPMPPEEDIEWGNDAWWDVQKRYIDESLYVNHDWDIFKDDK